ncbi:pentapeptide repeat-containing protein [Merismopedia glauca]|uniref:DNA/RNA helicase n=1 Tax=Merismopedia glauca CCAP 1448/3 TaxID=1296344 RepID=A0A2T1CAL9_9CYAN|nr:pentapeptide repeat-containing protein [Merismopedia glauca]PSB05289.1 DNA/RNA helicase [Merismopedia glauca CCAP 1448/3]
MKFITTEAFGKRGETGEKQVWEAVKRVFTPRECVVYWRYPIFSQVGKARQEPDILIVDRELGLIVIEVKSISIEQIINIVGHCWQVQNFYTQTIRPYEQAENQLFSLLEFSDREPSLHRQVTARALVALPQITQIKWQKRSLDRLPSCPSILFLEHLNTSDLLLKQIQETTPLINGKILKREQWKLLLTRLGGAPIFQKSAKNSRGATPDTLTISPPPVGSRGWAILEAKKQPLLLNPLTETNFKQIPPGCQRIRGMAGSGKTTLLCQKAAYMHLEHPEWDIALVFFSRSLYQKILGQLDFWLYHLSDGEVEYTPHHPKLKVVHAWGGKNQAGLYSTICQAARIDPLKVDRNQQRQPQEDLALACRDLLKNNQIKQIFDVIFIDEAQELLVKDELKFDNQQPFYALAYQALRPVNPQEPERKRLIWADDVMQSWEIGKTATASELFGDRYGQLVSGTYDEGIRKTLFLHHSHRTPEPIIVAAQAIAMGLARSQGSISGMIHPQDWMAIGYQIQGNFLQRLPPASPHPILELSKSLPSTTLKEPLLEFTTYITRQSELTALAANIFHNIHQEGIKPSQQILVIILGSYFEAAKLETEVANFLISQGIDIFIPGTNNRNILQPEPQQRDPNKFWYSGAITISRIRRAKGNEADIVYVVGCDLIARQESALRLRHQLFIALTRTRGWVKLSGIGENRFYKEIGEVIASQGKYPVPQHPLKHYFTATETGEILQRYAAGDRNFAGVDLRGMQLAGVNLSGANLIGAMFNSADLSNSQLDGAKLVIADLTAANLTGASLKKAKLVGAILHQANLTDADLSYADLTDVDLQDVDLSLCSHCAGSKLSRI